MERLTHRKDFRRVNLRGFADLKVMYAFAQAHVKAYRPKEFAATWKRIEEMARIRLTEELFLREYLWCVYVAGFSAKIVSSKYDGLLKAHKILDEKGNYRRVTLKELNDPHYTREVFPLIANRQKAKAINKTRQLILELGWPKFRDKFLKGKSPERIQGLAFMGPALSCHLARNLGNKNVSKPDVHLMRLAKHYGCASVQQMCESLGTPAGRVDLIIWYTCADHATK